MGAGGGMGNPYSMQGASSLFGNPMLGLTGAAMGAGGSSTGYGLNRGMGAGLQVTLGLFNRSCRESKIAFVTLIRWNTQVIRINTRNHTYFQKGQISSLWMTNAPERYRAPSAIDAQEDDEAAAEDEDDMGVIETYSNYMPKKLKVCSDRAVEKSTRLAIFWLLYNRLTQADISCTTTACLFFFHCLVRT